MSHTPEQTGGFSDDDLLNIILRGDFPDGGFFDSTIVTYAAWHNFHRWADITTDQQRGIITYLRAETEVVAACRWLAFSARADEKRGSTGQSRGTSFAACTRLATPGSSGSKPVSGPVMVHYASSRRPVHRYPGGTSRRPTPRRCR